ncbi:hypothetical protein G5B40_09460 [Pikeienuella piscinae]|uniref:Recombinase domain-containing protein n=1 Tax=Pikeienuella piscinae TaxID=2748098 RepID=A0A7L5BV08_9RHOB|nr:recombinase family protein [Pikeienuella piscinae]QIE55655.1 hypothetical protein G5B40_09460 [Pikeienuella piscinae]
MDGCARRSARSECGAQQPRASDADAHLRGPAGRGVAPLGYDAKGRTFIVNAAEAATVRTIFKLYLEHGSIRSVQAELDRMGLRTKHRPGLQGTAVGGARYGRGHLQHLLTNPVYIGRIRHKETTYDGAHDAIIGTDVWEAVQERLIHQSAKDRGRIAVSAPSPLLAKIVDETGDRLTPTHANKKGRRYRYYVSHRLIAPRGALDASGWRVSAERLERASAEAIASRMEETAFAIKLLDSPAAVEIERVRRSAAKLAEGLRGERRNALLAQVIAGGSISPDAIAIELASNVLASLLEIDVARIDPSHLSIIAHIQIRRRGVETRIVIGDAPPDIDRNLITKIGEALRWFEEVKAGASIQDIAGRERVTRQRVGQVLRLAFLAPGLVDDALAGMQPLELTTDRIVKAPHMELWKGQRAWAANL